MLKSIVKIRDMIRHSEYWEKSINDQKFITRMMYKDLKGERAVMNWRKLFYQNHARPHARFTLWLAILGRIPTKDRLERIGIRTDGKCTACDNVEAINHIFFACRFTQQIWITLL